ncbi:ATP-binding protein, partial [Bacillus sp. SIMBA_033]
QRLRQIIDGLIGNALRITPPGQPLALRAWLEESGRVIGVEVHDSGPGLTAEDAAVAFERGALSRRYTGQRPTGSGLGLS